MLVVRNNTRPLLFSPPMSCAADDVLGARHRMDAFFSTPIASSASRRTPTPTSTSTEPLHRDYALPPLTPVVSGTLTHPLSVREAHAARGSQGVVPGGRRQGPSSASSSPAASLRSKFSPIAPCFSTLSLPSSDCLRRQRPVPNAPLTILTSDLPLSFHVASLIPRCHSTHGRRVSLMTRAGPA